VTGASPTPQPDAGRWPRRLVVAVLLIKHKLLPAAVNFAPAVDSSLVMRAARELGIPVQDFPATVGP
jgi:hypothetical protein